MTDRPMQPSRDPLPEEPGAPRESPEAGGLGDVVPGETREPTLTGTGAGGPGVADPMAPQPPVGEPGVGEVMPGETREQTLTGTGVGGPGVGDPMAPQQPTGAGGRDVGETIEPKSTGEGFVDSMKDALRKVKDAVTGDDSTQGEEESRGHLPQEPPEGRDGGVR